MLRFWLAIWVCLSHFGVVLKSHSVIALAVNNAFNGAAAVIGFFIVSGFCIHWPYRHRSGFAVSGFYVRRFTRILSPLIVAAASAKFFRQDLLAFYGAILWSLIAELVYYAIYPLFFKAFRTFGISRIIVVSYLPCITLVLMRPRALNFHEFGPCLTWLVGLPCWLLGCQLTGKTSGVRVLARSIWTARLIVWALSVLASILRFHAGIGYPISLSLVAPVLYWWLRMELGSVQKAGSSFISLGQISYSVYLTHGLAVSCLIALAPWADSNIAVVLRLAVILMFAGGFYAVIERPAHRAARMLSRMLSPEGACDSALPIGGRFGGPVKV